MLPTYASFRAKPPIAGFSLQDIPGTAASDTRNIRLQYHSAGGRSLLSDALSVTGTGVKVTLNPDLILDGEEVFWILITLETTGKQEDAAIIAMWQARDNLQLNRRTLPVELDFTTDEHFLVNRNTNDLVNYPVNSLRAGAIAYDLAQGKYYRYDPESYQDSDGRFRSYGAYVDDYVGNWIRWHATNLAYIASRSDLYGSDRRISSIQNALKIPPKIGTNLSVARRYWLNNGLKADAQSPLINGEFTFELKVNGSDRYQGFFDNKIVYYLRGYVNRDTGILDETVANVGINYVWNSSQPIKLSQDLPRNHAAVIDVILDFNNDEALNIIPGTTPEIQLDIVENLPVQGQHSELAIITGSVVLDDLNQLLIVPGLTRLSGIGLVKKDGAGALIVADNPQPVLVEAADTPNQQVVMMGSLNGLTKVIGENEQLQYLEVLRAVISTEPGISEPVAAGTLNLTNQGIQVTVTHSATVRNDYPDTAIAGNTQGRFTPTQGYVFIEMSGTIYQSNELSLVTPTSTHTFTDLTSFTTIANLPSPDPDFNLFTPQPIVEAVSGSITGTASTWFSYNYASPNLTVTKINHLATGAIPTLNKTLAEAINDSLARAENLNDLPDKAIARSNLDVYSKEEIDLPQAVQDNAIAALSNIVFLTTKEIQSLPYTLTKEDHGHELYIDQNLTGKIIVPNDISEFNPNYLVLVSLDIPASIEYDREDENQTGLIFSNSDRFQRSIGEVIIRRRNGTNVFKITGFLES